MSNHSSTNIARTVAPAEEELEPDPTSVKVKLSWEVEFKYSIKQDLSKIFQREGGAPLPFDLNRFIKEDGLFLLDNEYGVFILKNSTLVSIEDEDG